MNLQNKDALYYSDLIYELKSLAGFEQQEDVETLRRIIQRKQTIVIDQESELLTSSYQTSEFMQEVIEIIIGISKKAGVHFKSANSISNYPELVNEVLADLENKKNELNNTSILKNSVPVLRKTKNSDK